VVIARIRCGRHVSECELRRRTFALNLKRFEYGYVLHETRNNIVLCRLDLCGTDAFALVEILVLLSDVCSEENNCL
jgi:hypothetical protein